MKYFQLFIKNKKAILIFITGISLAIIIISISGFKIKDGEKEFEAKGLLRNKQMRVNK